ncbi:MAG: ABC transporter permease [Acidimicrobiia bacterium]
MASRSSIVRLGGRGPEVLAAVVLAGLVVYPLGRLLLEAIGDGMFQAVWREAVATAAFNSLWSSALAASIALAVGIGLALLTERFLVRGASLMRAAVVATLVVPPFVSALSWQAAYAPFGLLDDWTGISAVWLEGRLGVVTVIAVNTAPLAYLVVVAALRSSRVPELEWAARAAGADRSATLRLVTLPMVKPALAAGWLVGFAASLSSFGVPVVLGTPAGFETLTTRVYRAVAFAAFPDAFQEAVIMALLLAAVALVVVMAGDSRSGRVDWRLQQTASSQPAYRRPAPFSSVAAAWVYLVLTVGIPSLALVVRALTPSVGVSPAPANWTLDNFATAFDSRTWEAFGRSVLLGLGAALLALAASGLLIQVRRTTGRRWDGAALVMFALPGTSLALGVSLGYGRWLANTAAIILIAYVAKLLALAHRPLAASAAGVHRDLLSAARASGATARRAIGRIGLPLLRPGLVAGGLLVFLFALHELTISSLLHGPGNETLAVVILDYQQIGDPTVTAALAVMLAVAVGAAATLLLLARRGRDRS